MTVIFGDRVQETFTTTGTGTITLGGAVTGYQAFSSVVANSGTCYYSANDGTNWEVGIGTYTTSGNTLARTAILSSSNSGTAVSWAAGTKNIFLDLPAAGIQVPLQSMIAGLIPTAQTFSSSTSASMTISSGQATDSTLAVNMVAPNGFSWNITNGNAANGYSGGTTLPNSSTIHFFIIQTIGGINASFASTSLTPTLPSGYTYYRRIFSLTTNSSGVLLAGTITEVMGGSISYSPAAATIDINAASVSTQANYTLTVPQGIKVMARVKANVSNSNVAFGMGSLDEAQAWANTQGRINIECTTSYGGAGLADIITNTSGQIWAAASSAVTVSVGTYAWIDFRRS